MDRALKIFLLSFFLTLSWAWIKPFYTKGEAREALAAEAILNEGRWILPIRYGDEIATKPPLTHWFMAILSLPFGQVTEGSARLPSVFLSSLTLALFFVFLRKRIPEKEAILASCILFGTIEWQRASMTARVDMTLAAFLLLSLFNFYEWEESGFTKFPLGASLLLSFATLAKGPVALALPAAILSLYLLMIKYQVPFIIKKLFLPFLLALSIPALWYLLAFILGGEEFKEVALNENFRRFLGTMDGGDIPHANSVWYLYGTVVIGLLPWCFLPLIGACKTVVNKEAWPDLFNTLRLKLQSISKLHLFSIISIFVFIFFYSIPSSKRSVYLLPIYPFLSLLLAPYFTAHASRFTLELRLAGSVLCGAIIFIYATSFLTMTGAFYPDWFISSEQKLRDVYFYFSIIEGIRNLPVYQKLLLLIPLILSVTYLMISLRGKRGSLFALTSAYFVLLVMLNYVLLPYLATYLCAKDFAQALDEKLKCQTLYSYGKRFYDVDYYYCGGMQEINKKLLSNIKDPFSLLVLERQYDEFTEWAQGKFIFQKKLVASHPIEKINNIPVLIEVRQHQN